MRRSLQEPITYYVYCRCTFHSKSRCVFFSLFNVMKDWSFLGLVFFFVKGPAADATDAPQPWCLLCNPVIKMINFVFVFPYNGAPVKWNWQGKTEVLGGKTCPSSTLSTTNPPYIDSGSNRASEVRGRRLTTWAMARPLDAVLQMMLRWRTSSSVFREIGMLATGKQVTIQCVANLLCFQSIRFLFLLEDQQSWLIFIAVPLSLFWLKLKY